MLEEEKGEPSLFCFVLLCFLSSYPSTNALDQRAQSMACALSSYILTFCSGTGRQKKKGESNPVALGRRHSHLQCAQTCSRSNFPAPGLVSGRFPREGHVSRVVQQCRVSQGPGSLCSFANICFMGTNTHASRHARRLPNIRARFRSDLSRCRSARLWKRSLSAKILAVLHASLGTKAQSVFFGAEIPFSQYASRDYVRSACGASTTGNSSSPLQSCCSALQL